MDEKTLAKEPASKRTLTSSTVHPAFPTTHPSLPEPRREAEEWGREARREGDPVLSPHYSFNGINCTENNWEGKDNTSCQPGACRLGLSSLMVCQAWCWAYVTCPMSQPICHLTK